jgi:hypothetical protein
VIFSIAAGVLAGIVVAAIIVCRFGGGGHSLPGTLKVIQRQKLAAVFCQRYEIVIQIPQIR